MSNPTLVAAGGPVAGHRSAFRASVAVGGLALVLLATMVLLQHRAEAAVAPQIDVGGLIRAIVCPILNTLAGGPFGAFIGGIVNALRAAFGCIVISG